MLNLRIQWKTNIYVLGMFSEEFATVADLVAHHQTHEIKVLSAWVRAGLERRAITGTYDVLSRAQRAREDGAEGV